MAEGAGKKENGGVGQIGKASAFSGECKSPNASPSALQLAGLWSLRLSNCLAESAALCFRVVVAAGARHALRCFAPFCASSLKPRSKHHSVSPLLFGRTAPNPPVRRSLQPKACLHKQCKHQVVERPAITTTRNAAGPICVCQIFEAGGLLNTAGFPT